MQSPVVPEVTAFALTVKSPFKLTPLKSHSLSPTYAEPKTSVIASSSDKLRLNAFFIEIPPTKP
jgi:hypothetical protein